MPEMEMWTTRPKGFEGRLEKTSFIHSAPQLFNSQKDYFGYNLTTQLNKTTIRFLASQKGNYVAWIFIPEISMILIIS